MKSWLKAAAFNTVWVATLAMASNVARAQGASAPAVAQHVPADAALLVALRLPDVEDGFAFADLLTGLYPQLAQALTALRAPLALPAFSESELAERGVQSEKSAFLALFRVPPKIPRTAPGFAHRLVVPVSDKAKFLAFTEGVFKRAKFATSVATVKPLAWAKPLVTVAKKKQVELWGFDARTAQGAAVRFVTSEESLVALIDVFTPDLPKPPGKKANGIFASTMQAMLSQTDIPPLASVWENGTRNLLGERASMVAVVQPNHLLAVLPQACRARFTSSAGAFFNDAAVVARLNPFDWKVRLSFAPAPGMQALLRQGGTHDGLVDTRALADAGLGAAALLFNEASPWLSVPRPAVLGTTFKDTQAQWEACGAAAMGITLTQYWPHLLLGSFAHTVTDLATPDLAKSARNVAVALRSPMQGEAHASALWLASFDAQTSNAVISSLSSRADAPAEAAAFGSRTPRLWSFSKAGDTRAAGVETLPGNRVGLALSNVENGLGWYYSEKRRPAVFGNRSALGSMYVNIKRLLTLQAETADVDTRDAISLATSQISRMGGDLVNRGDLLEMDLSLSASGP